MISFIQRAIGILLMLTALAVPLMQAPDRPVESLVARWALPPSDFIDVRGQLVHVRDQGPRTDPAPIVLLHGTGASLHTWEGWVAALKGQRRVITLDLPGFGLTGPFTGQYTPDDYRGDTLARFVLDVLDTLKLPKVVLGGNSLGGELAWRMATLAPQRVERLVLVDAAGYAFTPESQPLAFRIARIPALSWLTENLLPRAAVAASVQNVYGDPTQVKPELVDRYYELALRSGNRRALGLRFQQMLPGQGSERIATLKQPTLILWGGRDRLIPPVWGQRFAKDIAGSRLVVFDTLGHVPQEEDPARTVLVLREFLATN